MKKRNNIKVVYIGNYPPRQCGIGTFTENLVRSITQAAHQSDCVLNTEVIAMNNGVAHTYPDIVSRTIQEDTLPHYLQAADYINREADACIIQHEYGIFGGDHGRHILRLVDRLEVPLLVTLHTVLKQPSVTQRQIVRLLGEKAHQLVVMSQTAKQFLVDSYGVSAGKVAIIEHGVPNFPLGPKETLRRELGFTDQKILLTFGLLGPGKGIETMIRALPAVVEKHPDVAYWVLGKTHPNIVKAEGERYRESLIAMAEELGVGDHLVMKNEFVDEETLFNYLRATDIYVTPYPNEAQITSGTLSYAVGAGTPVVSTPYWHAQELLADGRGRYFDFRNADQLAETLIDLFNQKSELTKISTLAASYGNTLKWFRKGQEYLDIIQDALDHTPQLSIRPGPNREGVELPPLNFEHLINMTDSTGVIQHAKYAIPNFREGYCLDDNARALLLGAMAYRQGNRQLESVIRSSLSYLYYVQREDGQFRNFVSYDRRFLDETGSEDAFGRAIWALGYALANPPGEEHEPLIRELYYRAFDQMENLGSLRAMAYSLLGICSYLERYPEDERNLSQLRRLQQRMVREYQSSATDTWPWYETVLAYGNGLLPLALIRTLDYSDDPEVREVAFRSINFLTEITLQEGYLRPVGCNPFYRRGEELCYYDQQPIDAMAMVLLYDRAYRQTLQTAFFDRAWVCFEWFTGKNDLGLPLYNANNGGCYDGLMADGINLNQGAESTIAYLIARLTMEELQRQRKVEIKEVLQRSGHKHLENKDAALVRIYRRKRVSYMKD
ncbi:glycosyltransferase family 4 protein [Flavilitoribacter nigricans]|uniref:Glycosyl transferase n=1 Tax=Flavilitoribacter nigricans (strain ATCC 23147 / DSM 23189 / NBRC 102662 / NCIMB 1420 / SS-2) TaxID=1122177 RepID=A0A2D0NAI1_FLAN2|nr:glycosyltransferase family 4 protein [Flavilitoribacter nigricans]PHN05522.1 glycosyl transferase [Flavilitoribacter nigricans DSM 23189 = NBRC 102662]